MNQNNQKFLLSFLMSQQQTNMISIEKTKDWFASELETLKNLITTYAKVGQIVPTQVLLESLPQKSTHQVVAKHRAERNRLSLLGECMNSFNFFFIF